MPNPQAGGPLLARCLHLLIQYIDSYPLYLEVFPLSAVWGFSMLWWQGTHQTWWSNTSTGKSTEKLFNLRSQSSCQVRMFLWCGTASHLLHSCGCKVMPWFKWHVAMNRECFVPNCTLFTLAPHA